MLLRSKEREARNKTGDGEQKGGSDCFYSESARASQGEKKQYAENRTEKKNQISGLRHNPTCSRRETQHENLELGPTSTAVTLQNGVNRHKHTSE